MMERLTKEELIKIILDLSNGTAIIYDTIFRIMVINQDQLNGEQREIEWYLSLLKKEELVKILRSVPNYKQIINRNINYNNY